uniref:Light-independent protochlorophyllide reductase subunit B n=1 Tax=Chlorogonium capillatum TaxID=71743 RepID=A0A0S2IDA6_9CHLO|nr:ChlB subunit of protochlorophyllide reductase [Chlorogonium capillatum]
MKLAYWMYAGPAHIGTLRVASSFKNVHAIMHAPLGDDYFNVMRSMLERERDFTPVTASIVDRHVLARGSQEKVVENFHRKEKEERPDLILLTPTCTSSILQEDLQNFVNRANNEMSSNCDVLLADVNHYRVNEFQAADRTLEQIVRFYIEKAKKDHFYNNEPFIDNYCVGEAEKGVFLKEKEGVNGFCKTPKPSANILGVFTLGFHNLHDCRELKNLLTDLGIEVNEIIPEGGTIKNLKNLPKAWFNIVPYRENGLMTAVYLEKEFSMPYTNITPMGIVDTAAFIREIGNICRSINTQISDERRKTKMVGSKGDVHTQDSGRKPLILNEIACEKYIEKQTYFVSQAAWFSRSIDCQNLTGKKTVVFGDATHAASMTKILVREMGIHVVCAGTYCKHDADWFREQVSGFCDQILITDDHSQIGDIIAQIEPAAIFGTQMERHVGKRLDIPCGVISAPVHIQNFPLGFRPFLGYEGTNQISDLVYNSFSLGMEDHLLEIFNGHDNKEVVTRSYSSENNILWTKEALAELEKVPGFVRAKVKRNTEKYAQTQKIQNITLEAMYAAKEAVS